MAQKVRVLIKSIRYRQQQEKLNFFHLRYWSPPSQGRCEVTQAFALLLQPRRRVPPWREDVVGLCGFCGFATASSAQAAKMRDVDASDKKIARMRKSDAEIKNFFWFVV